MMEEREVSSSNITHPPTSARSVAAMEIFMVMKAPEISIRQLSTS
jgi:hypothetical protein